MNKQLARVLALILLVSMLGCSVSLTMVNKSPGAETKINPDVQVDRNMNIDADASKDKSKDGIKQVIKN